MNSFFNLTDLFCPSLIANLVIFLGNIPILLILVFVMLVLGATIVFAINDTSKSGEHGHVHLVLKQKTKRENSAKQDPKEKHHPMQYSSIMFSSLPFKTTITQ